MTLTVVATLNTVIRNDNLHPLYTPSRVLIRNMHTTISLMHVLPNCFLLKGGRSMKRVKPVEDTIENR